MTARRRLPILAAAMAGAVLTACVSAPPEYIYTTPADHHQPQVTRETARLDLLPDYRGGGLNRGDAGAVAAFVRDYQQIGHGALVLSAPAGADTYALREDIRAVAAAAGVPLGEIPVIATAAEEPGAPFNLTFTLYEAHAPECGRNWPDLRTLPRSQSYPNFGCALNANMAAMIADPADLVWPRETDPADAARRSTVLDAYRAGQPTATTRTDQDSASVSGLSN